MDVIKDAMIQRAIKKAADKQAWEQKKRDYEAREQQERQKRLQYLEQERQILHQAQQTIKGINDAFMEHFGKKD
jgi:hypothetical protein